MIPNPTENTVVLYHKISSIKIRKVSIIRLLLHFPIHLDLYALRRWRSPFSFASTKNLPPFIRPSRHFAMAELHWKLYANRKTRRRRSKNKQTTQKSVWCVCEYLIFISLQSSVFDDGAFLCRAEKNFALWPMQTADPIIHL